MPERRGRSGRACRAVSAAALLLAACAPSGTDAGAGTGDAPRTVTGAIDLSIGALDGDDAYVFGRISGLALHPDGRILVADAQADQVRVFSPAGEILYSIGRTGAGPGELSGPCCPAIDAAGRLWVRDGGNSRYNVYALRDDAAEFVRSVKMAHGDVNRWAPVTFDASGNLIDIGTRPDLAGGDVVTARMHLDSTGVVLAERSIHAAPPDSLSLHKVTRQVAGGVATRYLWQPYGALELYAHSPRGDYAYALSSRPAVTWFDEQGAILRDIRVLAEEGPPLSAAERAAAEERMAEDARWAGLTPAALPFRVPDRKSPLHRLFFDADGRLWVELSVPDGEVRRAEVYATDGTHLRTAEWPADVEFSLGAIRADVAIGVRRDSLDVARVVRVRWR